MMGYGWGMGFTGWFFMGLFANGELDTEEYRRARAELAAARAARGLSR
jgi:hypothetical protein